MAEVAFEASSVAKRVRTEEVDSHDVRVRCSVDDLAQTLEVLIAKGIIRPGAFEVNVQTVSGDAPADSPDPNAPIISRNGAG